METPASANDQFEILTIHNPSDTPFPIYYNSKLHKTILPHKAVQVVNMVGAINVEHLIDRMCKIQGVSKNDPSARTSWRSKILIGSAMNIAPVNQTLEEQALNFSKNLDKAPSQQAMPPVAPTTPVVTPVLPVAVVPVAPLANPAWKFDPVTGEPLVKKPAGITPDQVDTTHVEIQNDGSGAGLENVMTTPAPHPDPETNSILQGLRNQDDGGRVLKVDDDGSDEQPQVPANKTGVPTREELMTFAATIMAVNDPKTKAALDAMSNEELAAELRYNEVTE